MLRRYDYRVHPGRLPTVIFDGHLRLAVWEQPGNLPSLARRSEPAAESMGQGDRQRHQFCRLVAGETDHHALVTGADPIEPIDLLTGANLHGLCNATQYFGTLILDGDHYAAGVGVEPMLGVRV